MTDPSSKRSRRPDSRQMWDEADKRGRGERGERGGRDRRGDRRDDRDRDRRRDDGDHARDSGRDRGRRYRDRSAERPRDRPRSRSRDRAAEPDKRWDRNKDNRRRDEGQDGGRGKMAKDRDERERPRPKDKGRERRRSASPRRSRSPKAFDDDDSGTELPTRPKIERPAQPTAPLTFKVSGQDRAVSEDERGRSADRGHTGSERRDDLEATPMDEDEEEIVVEDDGMGDMAAMMGFGGFGSTKGMKVAGNNVGAVRKEKKTEYRQYMNRVGGFNRPLSPSR